MTVSSTTTKNSYSGDGSTTTFAYAFKIFADADLTVILRSAAGTETVQTLTTDYSVTNAGNANGGNVVFVTAPASGVTVVIRRNMAQTQSTDYVANDPFPAATHEDALDRLTFIAQQQQEEVDRSIKLSRTNTMTSTEFTVGATDRANKVLAFDGNGELSVTQELGTYKGTDATVTTEAYVVRDIIKSTTAGQLNNVYICVADAVIGDLLTDTDHFELLVDAVTAATSATSAASSASAAATSETNAATSESNAATSASNAATSESNASTSETNAATSATSASNSATSAASSATTATTKASEASTSATNAATSESNASTSATNAATSATNASTSETNAATSATTATTQASAASTSASNAATSASNASTSETNAAASAAAAAASADTFDDTYLGSKSSDPSVDNDGDALNAGDLYFNTTSNTLKVYTGSAWQDAAIDSSGFVQTTGDTMTGNLLLPNGAVGTPSIGFASDTNTGIYRGGTDILKFVTAGTDAVTIDASQNVTLASDLTIQGNYVPIGDGSSTVQLALLANTTGNSTLDFGDSADGNIGRIQYEHTNDAMLFRTNNLERMRITSGGDFQLYEDTGTTPKFFWDASAEALGLGTTSPAHELHIVGASDTRGIITSGGTGDSVFMFENASGNTWGHGLDFSSGNYAIAYNASGDPSLTGDGLLNIDSSGNVGIGTSSPSYELEVEDSSGNSYISIISSNTSDSAILFGDTDAAARGGILYDNADNSLAFRTATNTERMRIDSSGNVGIGTSSPASQFHVSNSVNNDTVDITISNTYYASSSADESVGIAGQFYQNDVSANRTAGLIRFNKSGDFASNANASGNITFFTRNAGSLSERMRIASSGNVGIGTSSPSQALDVNGTIVASTTSSQGARIERNGSTGGANFDSVLSSGSLHFRTGTTERTRIIDTGFFKTGNLGGTYRGATATYHEMLTDKSGDGVATFSMTNASYAGGGFQVVAARTATGDTYRLFEGYSGNGADREFRVDSDGTVHADGSYTGTGADYAEMFEWSDGNTTNEDRVGKTVVLDGNQIRLSTSDDAQSSIIGVVSARPVVLGDAQSERWFDKYEMDDFGRHIREEYTQTEWIEEDEDGNKLHKSYETDKIPSDVTVPSDAIVTSMEVDGTTPLTRRKLNSSYDSTQTYIPREQRKEFSPIGLVGKLRVEVGQIVGDRWIKMREISDTVHEYLVR